MKQKTPRHRPGRAAGKIEKAAQKLVATYGRHGAGVDFIQGIRTLETFELIVLLSMVAEEVGEAKFKRHPSVGVQIGWRDAILNELSSRT